MLIFDDSVFTDSSVIRFALLLLLLSLLLRLVGVNAKANLLEACLLRTLYFLRDGVWCRALDAIEMAYPAFADEELPNADAHDCGPGGGIRSESRAGGWVISILNCRPVVARC